MSGSKKAGTTAGGTAEPGVIPEDGAPASEGGALAALLIALPASGVASAGGNLEGTADASADRKKLAGGADNDSPSASVAGATANGAGAFTVSGAAVGPGGATAGGGLGDTADAGAGRSESAGGDDGDLPSASGDRRGE